MHVFSVPVSSVFLSPPLPSPCLPLSPSLSDIERAKQLSLADAKLNSAQPTATSGLVFLGETTPPQSHHGHRHRLFSAPVQRRDVFLPLSHNRHSGFEHSNSPTLPRDWVTTTPPLTQHTRHHLPPPTLTQHTRHHLPPPTITQQHTRHHLPPLTIVQQRTRQCLPPPTHHTHPHLPPPTITHHTLPHSPPHTITHHTDHHTRQEEEMDDNRKHFSSSPSSSSSGGGDDNEDDDDGGWDDEELARALSLSLMEAPKQTGESSPPLPSPSPPPPPPPSDGECDYTLCMSLSVHIISKIWTVCVKTVNWTIVHIS